MTTDDDDFLLNAARQLAMFADRHDREEKASIATRKASTGSGNLDRAGCLSATAWLALLEALPYLKAINLQGAAIHIATALCAIDGIVSADTRTERQASRTAVEFALFSALNAVEKAGGFRLDDMGLGVIANTHCSPWREVEADHF